MPNEFVWRQNVHLNQIDPKQVVVVREVRVGRLRAAFGVKDSVPRVVDKDEGKIISIKASNKEKGVRKK